ncbi:MAG: hypothetical protein J6E46_13425 [Faecalicoccus sp.]|nr:hypothetical protein [Faecalicoccus sp.]
MVFLIEVSDNNWALTLQNGIGTSARICFTISIIAMAIAFVKFVQCLIPHMESFSTKEHPNKKYPVFFKDIQFLELEEYRKLMHNGTNEDYNDELITEIWHNSKICTKEMMRYRIALICSSISLGSMLVYYILTLIG